MPRLLSTALRLRTDPRILKLPPYLSLTFIIVGVVWLLLLPLNDYSRRTYISENALLPGQVHTYFSGSDQHIFRAYKHEIAALEGKDNFAINDELEKLVKGIGLKVGRQNYTYHSTGRVYSGQNIYGILQAPRGDATEAIVLVAAWKNMKDEMNRHGVPLALTLSRYFKRWSLWSKDIIVLFPPDSSTGTQAWVDAYHDSHDSSQTNSLPIKSGALQGAIAIDYPFEHRFKSVHIVYDGINGQLPNLDLINSVVNIAGGQMGFSSTLQEMWTHSDKYRDRLRTMFRGMLKQGIGKATGPHSSFIPYHVDAVTLQPFGEGWQDEMAMGRLIEGSFRSLNNLLEHLHQSFFFYLLMHKDRFVSIGTYLPSAMLLAANFTIMAIFLWVKSGQNGKKGDSVANAAESSKSQPIDNKDGSTRGASNKTPPERELFVPMTVVAGCHALGAVPLYIFNHTPSALLPVMYLVFSLLNTVFPLLISYLLSRPGLTLQQFQLIKCFSLLLLGMFLSSLATLNFSLAFLVGLLSTPLSFIQPFPKATLVKWAVSALLNLLAPTTVLLVACLVSGYGLGDMLRESAFGWHVWGMYTQVVICCVWWPAWVVGSVIALGKPV